ncbi:MAG: carbon-nitrogen hydrolase family protein [Deltaproteobacteria bacterium]|nr:carbon-nitrogen hydrolase family protein [Deltaproteobacteria bacterium]
MGKYLGVSVVQMNIVPGDTEANVAKLLALTEGNQEDFPWVNMVVWSELAIPGFNAATWSSQAEPIPGPTTERIGHVAKELGIYIVAGSMFEIEDGKYYNTTPVLGPDGSLVTKYRKMFPWRPLEPSTPGSDFCVFDIPDFCRVGVCICYDFWFPEVCRQLTWMGAEVIAHPTMTPTHLQRAEQDVARVRALENGVFMVSSSGCGLHGGLGLGGGSIIVDPEGRALQTLDNSENIVNELLSLERAELCQEYGSMTCSIPTLKHLGDYGHKFPVYQGNIKDGEFFKKRGGCMSIESYVKTKNVCLPFKG